MTKKQFWMSNAYQARLTKFIACSIFLDASNNEIIAKIRFCSVSLSHTHTLAYAYNSSRLWLMVADWTVKWTEQLRISLQCQHYYLSTNICNYIYFIFYRNFPRSGISLLFVKPFGGCISLSSLTLIRSCSKCKWLTNYLLHALNLPVRSTFSCYVFFFCLPTIYYYFSTTTHRQHCSWMLVVSYPFSHTKLHGTVATTDIDISSVLSRTHSILDDDETLKRPPSGR